MRATIVARQALLHTESAAGQLQSLHRHAGYATPAEIEAGLTSKQSSDSSAT